MALLGTFIIGVILLWYGVPNSSSKKATVEKPLGAYANEGLQVPKGAFFVFKTLNKS